MIIRWTRICSMMWRWLQADGYCSGEGVDRGFGTDYHAYIMRHTEAIPLGLRDISPSSRIVVASGMNQVIRLTLT